MLMEIPYGTRDFLPVEAAEKRGIENALTRLFARWGYEEVVTPSIEYLETLTRSSGAALEPRLFKLFDSKNRTLALRHEMTTPIARLASSRLQGRPLPWKLSYSSSVFRHEQAQAGRQCEFYQAGVELMGEAGAFADAEMIALAVQGLKESGLRNFCICIGQVEFVSGIMEQYRFSKETRIAFQDALEKRNLVELGRIIEELQIPANAKAGLKKLPLLSGDEGMLREAYALALNERSRRALDNLSEIYRLLKAYGAEKYVRFDLGIIRDFSYYTGMVFEAYTPGIGYPLCGGGRYDRLLTEFGAACPATGFAIGIERILIALEREGLRKPIKEESVYIGYAAGRAEAAIARASELRGKGERAELSMLSESEAEAEKSCALRGCAKLVYIA